jgi:signal transduction histidine kinase
VAELMSRAREEVLGVVAHDLRNPLHLVSSSAYLLAQPDLSTERRDAVFAATMRAVQRMNRLIGDLLDVVRMETGRLMLDHRACDVNRLLSQGAEGSTRAHRDSASCSTLSTADVTIEADEARVLQVIDNLVDNA